ncbi:DUF6429 family protein [Bradyrhizobium sp.]|uniref:DUF6429 family protein n=1 Tax=Bradyrhizobium sp. TaxID=376 RepID=UPI003C704665
MPEPAPVMAAMWFRRSAMAVSSHHHSRAWKGLDWDVLGRLYDKGMIENPVGEVKSVVLTGTGTRSGACQEVVCGGVTGRWQGGFQSNGSHQCAPDARLRAATLRATATFTRCSGPAAASSPSHPLRRRRSGAAC